MQNIPLGKCKVENVQKYLKSINLPINTDTSLLTHLRNSMSPDEKTCHLDNMLHCP